MSEGMTVRVVQPGDAVPPEVFQVGTVLGARIDWQAGLWQVLAVEPERVQLGLLVLPGGGEIAERRWTPRAQLTPEQLGMFVVVTGPWRDLAVPEDRGIYQLEDGRAAQCLGGQWVDPISHLPLDPMVPIFPKVIRRR